MERDKQGYDPHAANDAKTLKAEVIRKKHENRDLAAELDKAQSLLRLQTDIERENRQYFEQDRERLKLLAQSTDLKAREMAKRVDGQLKLIADAKRHLGLEQRAGFQSGPGAGGAEVAYGARGQSDVQSDFSLDPDVEELREGENFLDLRIIDAALNQELI